MDTENSLSLWPLWCTLHPWSLPPGFHPPSRASIIARFVIQKGSFIHQQKSLNILNWEFEAFHNQVLAFLFKPLRGGHILVPWVLLGEASALAPGFAGMSRGPRSLAGRSLPPQTPFTHSSLPPVWLSHFLPSRVVWTLHSFQPWGQCHLVNVYWNKQTNKKSRQVSQRAFLPQFYWI